MDVTQCGDVARGSYGAAGNGTAGIDVAIGDGSNPIGQGLAGYRSVAHGSTLTVGYRFTGDSCLGSDIPVFIYGEVPIGPFDLAVSTHSCLGFAVGIAAGVDTVFIHHRAVGANLDSLFVQGDLVVPALVQDHFVGIGLGGGHVALGVNGSDVLLQNIVIAQAHSAVDGFHQFGICCHTGRSFCRNLIIQCCISGCPFLGFLGICLVQGRESISHILVDGIEPIHHILADLLNHLVLGFICPNASIFFRIQSGIQVSHVFANGVGCFHDGPILYGGISLAYIIVGSLFLQIFLHIGDPGIQCRISRFTSGRFRIQVSLQLIRCFEDFVGFVRNPFVQFIILGFSGRRFILVSRSQGGNPLGRIFIDLLNHLVLGCISAKAGSRFFGQGRIQFGHIVADGVGGFHNSPILYGGIVLANIGIRSFLLQIFLHSGDPVIIGLDLFIQADQVISYRIVLFDIGTVFGSFVGHTICSHLTCYSHIASRGDITSRKASRSQFSTDFHVFDCLIFFNAYNQIASAGNMKGRAGLLVR